jgi:membrane protein involved in colicin uptake
MPPVLNLKDWADKDLVEDAEDGRVLAQAKLDKRMRCHEERLAREAEQQWLAEEATKKKAEAAKHKADAEKRKAALDAKRKEAADKAQVSIVSQPMTRIHEALLIFSR